jgi:hypothetical protein
MVHIASTGYASIPTRAIRPFSAQIGDRCSRAWIGREDLMRNHVRETATKRGAPQLMPVAKLFSIHFFITDRAAGWGDYAKNIERPAAVGRYGAASQAAI